VKRALAITLATTTALLGLAACGDDGGGEPSVCDQYDALKSSVDDLLDTNVVEEGLSGVRDSVDQVQTAAQDLADTAQSQLGSDVDALQSALSDLGQAISDGSASGVSDALSATSDAWGDLQTKVASETDCG
jgi:hypothetical protein